MIRPSRTTPIRDTTKQCRTHSSSNNSNSSRLTAAWQAPLPIGIEPPVSILPPRQRGGRAWGEHPLDTAVTTKTLHRRPVFRLPLECRKTR